MAGGSAPGASVVARALSILVAFDAHHRSMTLSQIAGRAGLSAPTTLRIVRQLVADGALERRESEYVIGRTIWDLGHLAPVQTDLREVASPYLQDLQAATRATVHLAVRDGQSALYVDRLSGRSSVPVVSTIGSRLPMHATGVGKVLLAHAPEEVRSAALQALSRETAYTVTAPGLLARQLARVVRDGYATTTEEMTLGACSVAVPVLGPEGDVAAALGIVVPTFKRDRARLVAGLQVAAQGIQRELARARPPGQEAE